MIGQVVLSVWEWTEPGMQEKSGNLYFYKNLNSGNIECGIVNIEYRYYNINRNIDTR